MQLELTREGGHLTAALIGELDHHAAAEVRQTIDTALLSCRPQTLRLDLSRLTFMDSSGIGLVMGRFRTVQPLGGKLIVSNLSPQVYKIMKLAGLEKIVTLSKREDVNNAEIK